MILLSVWLIYGVSIYAMIVAPWEQFCHGMTREQVLGIAGLPYHKHSDGNWWYRVWRFPLGTYSEAMSVDFDTDGLVEFAGF